MSLRDLTHRTRATGRCRPGADPRDRGSAMVITLMMLALVTALSTTVTVVTIDNLQGSRRAQAAGAALGAADAGVAQAMSYLRNNGVRDLKCKADDPPTSSRCTAAWGSGNRTTVTLPGMSGQVYEAWIEAVRPFPTNDPGLYKIHSVGTAAGPASREVVTEVSVTKSDVPQGIFARTISGGGSASVTRESVFSTGCVYDRSKIAMVEGQLDVAHGIPIGVHSSEIITESNGSGQYCPETKKPIHTASKPCNTDYPYDHDKLGGALGSSCEGAATAYPEYYGTRDLDGDGSVDVKGSYLKDEAALLELFDLKKPALSQSQMDQLKALASAQGNYWTTSKTLNGSGVGWTSPDEPNAVMYFDLGATDPGGTVDLNDITGFGRALNLSATAAACTTRSLVIVIDGGNAKLNSNQQLAAALFLTSGAPHGQVIKANGTSNYVGTVYADSINLIGNTDFSLDECFMDNQSPALMDFTLGNYQELDRRLDN